MATTLINIISAEPTIYNNGNELAITLQISNVGEGDALNVYIRNITLGSASRTSPEIFPIFVGNLISSNRGSVSVRFKTSGFLLNREYLLSIQGTYEVDASQNKFIINRYVKIPPKSVYPIEFLKARIKAETSLLTWNYTIYNDEPKTSQQFVAGFSLTIAAPITVTGVPTGWFVETDNLTFVAWFSEDRNMPYLTHVPPGEFLGGFQLKSSVSKSEATPYVLTSWRHDTNASGLIVTDYVATPKRII